MCVQRWKQLLERAYDELCGKGTQYSQEGTQYYSKGNFYKYKGTVLPSKVRVLYLIAETQRTARKVIPDTSGCGRVTWQKMLSGEMGMFHFSHTCESKHSSRHVFLPGFYLPK